MFHTKSVIGIGLCITLVVTAVSVGVYQWVALPTITILKPTMPSPNAFDLYVKAGNALVDQAKIKEIGTTKSTLSLKEKEALVAKNKTALTVIRAALPYHYHNPPLRSINDTYPYYKDFRQVARMLVLEGQIDAAHGQWNNAVNADLDAIQMGEEIPHGGVMVGDLVGVACQAIGQRQVWILTDHLDAAQARRAAARLEEIQTRHVPFADVLQEEKWFGQSAILEASHISLARAAKGHDSGFFIEMILKGPRNMMQHYSLYGDQCIKDTRLPYAAHIPEPPFPHDMVTDVFAPIFQGAFLRDTEKSQTQNALLTVSLALRAYYLEHGSYPVGLSELVPTYLHAIPSDPFALSGPLCYKRLNTRYVLYSLGPDSVDDHGKPIFDGSKPKTNASGTRDPRYFVEEQSKGDIVAGINI